MVPQRTFKIHKTFPLCKRFYIVEKVSNAKSNTKKKYFLIFIFGNPKMALHGIAASLLISKLILSPLSTLNTAFCSDCD